MNALLYHPKGHPDKLVYGDAPAPVPADDEVLIRVHAVSLNAADYRSMKMGMIPKRRIFGADIAGRIESVGKNVSLFKPGDAVLVDLSNHGFGGLAEYAAAPENALALKPESVSFEDAAATPLAAMTALQAVRDQAGVQPGQRVLIAGSAGGVGTFAVQLAKYFGADVTGVCSPGNVAQTRSLGADHVIDYTREDFTKSAQRYDVILAVNGNYPLLACKKRLTPTGTYVMVGGALPQIFKALLFGRLLSFGSKKIKALSAKANPQDLAFVAHLLETGAIKPVITQRYPLEQAAEAMRYLMQGHAAGKVVVQVANTSHSEG
ncbi:MAG: NAD(P)-dependent alcohol dehydrogenase [Haliscomenobacter sp.]|nr:NAD(P)-dependent alcohol dehydrogenase [Haliscomenobacter sp.]